MRSLKILIADDYEPFRIELAEFLKSQEGFEVSAEVRDGLEAIALIPVLRPDIVLMDIGMPRLNGIEAARKIKEEFPHTKIVFVTVHEDVTYKAMAEMLHVDSYVCKSSLKQDLPKVLSEIKAGLRANAD